MAIAFNDEIYGKIYPGWDRTAAEADWREQGDRKWSEYIGGSGGGGGNVAPLVTSEDYIQKIIDMLPKPKDPYTEVNPFFFDEEAAKEVSTAEFSPYYEEILGEYLSDVGKTRERVGEDTNAFLAELEGQKDVYMEKEGTNFSRLLRGVREGYSGKGLYFSGERKRTEGEAESDYQKTINDYMRRYGYETGQAETERQRKLEDLATEAERRERDIGREKETAVAGGVLQQRGEQQEEWLRGMEQYYTTPDWSSLLAKTSNIAGSYL